MRGFALTGADQIRTRYDPEQDVVLFEVRGRVAASDFLRAGDRHFLAHPDSIAVWDLRWCDLSGIRFEDLDAIAARSGEVRSGSANAPRSALVIDDESKRLLSRLFDALSERRRSPVRFQTFYSLDEAFEWLGLTNSFSENNSAA